MSEDDTIKDAYEEWDEEGLPPVGTECDILEGGNSFPYRVILGYDMMHNVVWMRIGGTYHNETRYIGNVRFKPADKRTDKEKDVDEMMKAAQVDKMESTFYIAMIEKLYDAGYRKESDNG